MIFCLATTNPLSVAQTSSHCLKITSSFPASDWLMKCRGSSCLRSAVIKGKKVDLASSDSGSKYEAPLDEELAAPMMEWLTGSGGTRAQKWPRV